MRLRTAASLTVVLLVAMAFAASAGAAVVGIYRNALDSEAQRSQVFKLFGERCQRGGSEEALRIVVGKATKECAYRTPVVGRDLEIAVTARLLSGTPTPVAKQAFLAVNLRGGNEGAHYQLAVFPLQRKAQLRKGLGEGKKPKFLHIEKGLTATKGLNRAIQLRLRAFNVTSGPDKGKCRILAWVGTQLVADFTDAAGGELAGRFSGLSVGTAHNAKGAIASFDDIVIRVPSPF